MRPLTLRIKNANGVSKIIPNPVTFSLKKKERKNIDQILITSDELPTASKTKVNLPKMSLRAYGRMKREVEVVFLIYQQLTVFTNKI